MPITRLILIAAFGALSIAGAWGAAPQDEKAVPHTHTLKCQLVAVTTESGEVTIRTADGKELTLPVEGKAAEKLARFQPGEDVVVTCRDNDQGEHQAIAGMRRNKAEGEGKPGQAKGGQASPKGKSS